MREIVHTQIWELSTKEKGAGGPTVRGGSRGEASPSVLGCGAESSPSALGSEVVSLSSALGIGGGEASVARRIIV